MRDLKASLSSYLRRVRAGASFTVTDRGRPVARIIPAGIPAGLEGLIRSGQLTWSGRKPVIPRDRPRVRSRKTLSDVVIEDRG